MVEFDEELHLQPVATPESIAIADEDRERLNRALESVPPRFREVLVLRELEGCSYKGIAAITSIPMGTVMSSLIAGCITEPRPSSSPIATAPPIVFRRFRVNEGLEAEHRNLVKFVPYIRYDLLPKCQRTGE